MSKAKLKISATKGKTTTDYEMFYKIPMNREVTGCHIAKMADSIIKTQEITRPVVVTKTNMFEGGAAKLYVLDGQHLLSACERLQIPVWYKEVETSSKLHLVQTMGRLNTTAKSWVLSDYVNAYKHLISDYMRLFDLGLLYNLDYVSIASLCQLDSVLDRSGSTAHIKNGNFKVKNEKADEMCKDFSDIALLIPDMDFVLRRKMLRGFIATDGIYNFKTVKNNISKHMPTLKLMNEEDETIGVFIRKSIFNLKK